jgi:thymidylate kinase
MPSIALIGPDGAGKTTLTKRLVRSSGLPLRYLYMGIDISASNVALPTSRLIERARGRVRTKGDATGVTRRGRGGVTGWILLANRLLEAWYRQVVSWSIQVTGRVVVYDRHFVLDFAPEVVQDGEGSLPRRVYRWTLRRLYPHPDLVIFLDAPGEVLYGRKGESTIFELERRRQAFLNRGRTMRDFRIVDATRPLEIVYAEVVEIVTSYCRAHGVTGSVEGPAAAGPERAA